MQIIAKLPKPISCATLYLLAKASKPLNRSGGGRTAERRAQVVEWVRCLRLGQAMTPEEAATKLALLRLMRQNLDHGCQMAIARFLGRDCLALRACEGLWLRYAMLQNLILTISVMSRFYTNTMKIEMLLENAIFSQINFCCKTCPE